MAFENPVFKEGFNLEDRPSLLPVDPPIPKAEPKKPEQPKPAAPLEKPQETKAAPVADEPSPGSKPGDIRYKPETERKRSVPREFLMTMGMLASGNRVLLPFQALPFSKGWTLLTKDITYYRWQFVLAQDEMEFENGVGKGLVPMLEAQHSIFIKKSYAISVKPDGCAGFTGARLTTGRPLLVDEVQRLLKLADCVDMRAPDILKSCSQAMKSVLPEFYWDIGLDDESARRLLHNHPFPERSQLRRIFDVQQQAWRWLYRLGGVGSLSPIIISDERSRMAVPAAKRLHASLGSRHLISTVYVGGCSVIPITPEGEELNPETPEQNPRLMEILEHNVNIAEPFEREGFFKLQAAVFSLQKPRLKTQGGDPQREEIRQIVDGPAKSMVEHIYGEPAIPGR